MNITWDQIPSKCDTTGCNKQNNTKKQADKQHWTRGEAKKRTLKFVLELVGIYDNSRVSNPCRALHTTRLIQLGLRSPCPESAKPPREPTHHVTDWLQPARTHTHTHNTHTPSHTHTSTRTRTLAHKHTQAHTNTGTHTHTYTHTHTHWHANTHTHTLARTLTD